MIVPPILRDGLRQGYLPHVGTRRDRDPARVAIEPGFCLDVQAHCGRRPAVARRRSRE